ncbi:MAG: DNA methyltransferase [Nitrososphaeraceae archaeon]
MNVILSTESVDVVVTSPPYNIGVDYHTYDDSLPRENYLRWIRDVCAAIRRILKPSSKYMEGFPRRLLFYASDAILLLHNVSSGVIV